MSRRRYPLAFLWNHPEHWVKKDHIGNEHVSQIILNELEEYAKTEQFYPIRYALYRYMTEPRINTRCCPPIVEDAKYPELTYNCFYHWYGRLISEGYIVMDESNSNAVRCVRLQIVERDEEPIRVAKLPIPDSW